MVSNILSELPLAIRVNLALLYWKSLNNFREFVCCCLSRFVFSCLTRSLTSFPALSLEQSFSRKFSMKLFSPKYSNISPNVVARMACFWVFQVLGMAANMVWNTFA